MSNTETYVRALIDKDLKQQAEIALKKMGVSVSDYIRMAFIRLIDEQAIPFQIKVPNETTLEAMKELKEGKGQKFENAEEMFKALDL